MRKITPEIQHRGSLLTYEDNGSERCIGYLLNFTGRGVFEPTFGKLDVSAEEAETHNRLLSQAEIHGLEQNCQVGQGGMFYTRTENGSMVVTTWVGQEVSRAVRIRGNVLTFTRKGKAFRGRLRKDQDCFFAKRIT